MGRSGYSNRKMISCDTCIHNVYSRCPKNVGGACLQKEGEEKKYFNWPIAWKVLPGYDKYAKYHLWEPLYPEREQEFFKDLNLDDLVKI